MKELQLPCYIGDIVFLIDNEKGIVVDSSINDMKIIISRDHMHYEICTDLLEFCEEDIGASVFLNEAEAKQVLENGLKNTSLQKASSVIR